MAPLTIHAPHDRHVQLGTVELDSPGTIEEKVQAAASTMRTWSRTAPTHRAEALLAIATDARTELEELARDLSAEQGKTVKEARLELERFIGAFEQYAGMATLPMGRHIRLASDVVGVVESAPVGVVAGIVPWNFPASLYGSKLAPALAAGCGFIIKPAETTPLITRRLTGIVKRHVPEGLVDVVIGGAEAGDTLVGHPLVARVAFTGSTPVGQVVGARAGKLVKRVSLELGGSDPFVLLDDADIPAAVRAIMGTRFYNAGQVCVAPKRLIVHEAVADAAIELLTAKIDNVVLGPGSQAGVTMGPLHTASGRERLEAQIADAAEHGAKIIGSGRPEGRDLGDGNFVLPSLVIDPPPQSRVRTEETFGPSLSIVRVHHDEEAVAVANETSFSLGASVWSADRHRALSLAERITSGYTWINTLARVYDELPFGGVGLSGIGREHGVEAFESYLERRSYVVAE